MGCSCAKASQRPPSPPPESRGEVATAVCSAPPPQQEQLQHTTSGCSDLRETSSNGSRDLDEGARPTPDLKNAAPVTVRVGSTRPNARLASVSADDIVSAQSVPWLGAVDGHQALIYAKAAKEAVGYLQKRVLNRDWVASHPDPAFYCKLPLALLEVGADSELAMQALDVAVTKCSNGGQGSVSEIYSTLYPQCPWIWIGEAAQRLKRTEVAYKCWDNIAAYVHPVTGSGLVKAPLGSLGGSWEADFFSTALAAKAALVFGQVEGAINSGESLLRAMEANTENMKDCHFQLRWSWADGFDEQSDPLRRVEQQGQNQLYSMLGFPALVLLELSYLLASGPAGQPARAPKQAAAFQEGAAELLRFLKGCPGFFDSTTSHSAAVAAAMATDCEAALKIGEGLLARQKPAGHFSDEDALDAVEIFDHAADAAIALSRMSKMMGARTSL